MPDRTKSKQQLYEDLALSQRDSYETCLLVCMPHFLFFFYFILKKSIFNDGEKIIIIKTHKKKKKRACRKGGRKSVGCMCLHLLIPVIAVFQGFCRPFFVALFLRHSLRNMRQPRGRASRCRRRSAGGATSGARLPSPPAGSRRAPRTTPHGGARHISH